MNVFMVGGTGLLGSAAASLFLERGHSVKSIALPPLPEGAPIPAAMELTFGDFLKMGDGELLALMEGCDCFVFAAGVDDRVDFKPPIFEKYMHFNVAPLRRLIPLAKRAGITRTVVLGSYFAYFNREFPGMRLAKKHPYIRSRVLQEELALSMADETMSVAVLELPYIFGTQPGRRPVWTIFTDRLTAMPFGVTMYPRGGTAMLTVRQVAQTVVGAAETSRGAKIWPIGYYNMNWDDFLAIVHTAMGRPSRKIVHIESWMFRAYGRAAIRKSKSEGTEMGINPVGLADIMCMNTFIDRRWARELGATDDDIKAAITDSIRLSLEAGKRKLLGMKSGG